MTSPRSTYGGGYYSSPSFPDTPIYDSLVAERGTPQIAPIRVPSPYDPSGHFPSAAPALPAALPALPAAPSHHTPPHGYPAQGPAQPQPGGLQHPPAPYIPPQANGPRGYPGPQPYPAQQAAPQPQRPALPGPGGPTGYEAMRPAMPRPAAPRPAVYEDQYGRQQQYPNQGY
ncbi:DUF6643 family protein [Streptomyces sp. SAJ15]|uniref:DUF6643 family protein n=1 Tax=Streptomyces sp. SAJ15 TaxID=2011095 RepID=UPI001186AFD4|nr:DUF6643 family protein [Streptomyces sp. SAJ15]TVL93343.1 hypothetical protein CD790_09615 [Streptomyces sp. SAJ15]